jgi:hypothetical protein
MGDFCKLRDIDLGWAEHLFPFLLWFSLVGSTVAEACVVEIHNLSKDRGCDAYVKELRWKRRHTCQRTAREWYARVSRVPGVASECDDQRSLFFIRPLKVFATGLSFFSFALVLDLLTRLKLACKMPA